MNGNTKRIDELAKKVKKGDKKAFEELYKLTSSRAYFTALQICNDKQEAEDILQESYVTALNKISSLERTESFMGWFNRIVANKSKDYLKKKNPDLFSEEYEWLLEGKADDSDKFSPESNVDKEELKAVVMDAVKELNVEKRTCVMMKYFNDMSVSEIAQAMEVPVSTVKNRLFDARKELKTLFEKKGITAAYSIAPFGVVGWAYNAAFENIAQSFEGSEAAAKIFSGIAVAGTAAASAATAGTAATGTGIFAKVAAASTMQKVISGIVVASVVTGSTIGITTAVRNKKSDDVPAASYTETADEGLGGVPDDGHLPVLVVQNDEEDPKHETAYIQKNINLVSEKTEYAGTVYEGINIIEFEGDSNRFYCDFYAEKTGYYLVYYKNNEDNKLKVSFDDNKYYEHYYNTDDEKAVNYWWTELDIDYEARRDIETDITTVASDPDYTTDYPKTLLYSPKGNRFIITESEENTDSAELVVEYYGEEITDVEFLNNSLENRILDYNLMAPYATSYDDSFRMNQFDVNIKFSSGKELYMGGTEIEYYFPEEIKAGENNAVFFFPGKGIEKKMTVHDMSEYISEIEIDELDEFLKFKINENGFDINEPEEYSVTVTYSDGTKETFNGAEWDKQLTFDDGTAVVLEFTQPKLTDRESVQFIVAAGDVEFIREPCQLTGIDPIGYTGRLFVISADIIEYYWGLTEPSYKKLLTESADVDEFMIYLNDVSYVTSFNVQACLDRLFGYGIDLFITFFKISTENIYC